MSNAGEVFSCEWAYYSVLHFRCMTWYRKRVLCLIVVRTEVLC